MSCATIRMALFHAILETKGGSPYGGYRHKYKV
jgi:hypothetical protein